MAFVVSSLPAYVQENRDLLIKNFALVGAGTRSRMSIQSGIKKDAYINLLNLSPALQDGKTCGFSASGDGTLSQRTISTAAIKVDMEFCEETLLGKYAEYAVRISATDNSLPFEAYILKAVTDEINKKIEKLIWQGDTSKTDADIKWTNGLLKIAASEADVVDVTIAGTSAYADILAVYAKMTEETLDKGGVIFVSPATFRAFMQEMVVKNFYHYNPGNDEPGEFILPGSDVKVVRTQGLAGKDEILGTFAENLVYGCDVEGDSESIDAWFSQDARAYRLQVKWNSGVQIAFPAEVVLGAKA